MKTRKYTIEGVEVSEAKFLKGIKQGKSGLDVYTPPTSHTLTPWSLDDLDGKNSFIVTHPSGDTETFAVCPDLSKEDAKFIVKAVNSHDALLEAAKFAYNNLSPKGGIRKDYSGHLAKATLSKAIQIAEGK